MRYKSGFCPAGICFDPMTLAIIAIGGSALGGYSSMQAANQEAALQRKQGELSLSEAKTNADQAAWNYTQDTQKQATAFAANGVTLEGSPSEVVKNTAAQGQIQVQSILNRGYADYTLAQQQAQITQNKGRAAMIGGIVGAASTYSKAQSAGYIGGANQTPSALTTGGDAMVTTSGSYGSVAEDLLP